MPFVEEKGEGAKDTDEVAMTRKMKWETRTRRTRGGGRENEEEWKTTLCSLGTAAVKPD